jgi:hypothetical protein
VLQAVNGWVCGYDNLSFMPDWLSDALCRLSTGAAFGRRALYTNDEESLFAAKRPIIYTAIGEIAAKSDLAERTIAVTLPRIVRHRTEEALWSAFQRQRPHILGALLDAVSEGLRNMPRTQLVDPPRMADFATWVTAAEPAFGWIHETFLRAYDRSRESAHEAMLEASAVGQAVLTFMATRDAWAGNAKLLLEHLDAIVDEATRRDHRHWPHGDGGPRALSGRLRTIAKDLRGAGLEVEYFARRGSEKRLWTLQWAAGRSPSGRGTVDRPTESDDGAPACSRRDGRDGPQPTLLGTNGQTPLLPSETVQHETAVPPSLGAGRERGEEG